jgi:threonine-phosphate decarboxylase
MPTLGRFDIVNKLPIMDTDSIYRLHGGNIRLYQEQTGLAAEKIIDFSANINPLGLAQNIKRLIIKKIDDLVYYPEPQSRHLKKSLACFHRIQPTNLLIGNGSIELIYLLPRALRIKTGLIITPTFSEYEFALSLNKAKLRFLETSPQNDFKIEISKLLKFVGKVEVIFLCNPNNPTGFLMPAKDLLLLVKLCRHNKTILIIDEAFMDFVGDCRSLSMVNTAVKSKNILVLRSMTKFFAFAGLRLGYLIGHWQLIENISRFQHPWNINSLAQAAAEEVIKQRSYIKRSRTFILREREYLSRRLKNIKGIKVYPSSANFIFCKLESKKIKSTKILSKKLTRLGIIIRDCSNFRGLDEGFFRVAVRKRIQNNRLLRALENIL